MTLYWLCIHSSGCRKHISTHLPSWPLTVPNLVALHIYCCATITISVHLSDTSSCGTETNTHWREAPHSPSTPPALQNSHLQSVCINLAVLQTSLKWNLFFVLLWLAYFTEHNVLQVHLFYSVLEYVFPFDGWLMVHPVAMSGLLVCLLVETWVSSTLVLLCSGVFKYCLETLLSDLSGVIS